MLSLPRQKVQRLTLVGLLALGSLGTLAMIMPSHPVQAQVRALPDFTDLVEQVGPSVVNIRTLEKVSGNANPLGGAGGGDADEQMQELLRRFFGDRLVIPNTPKEGKPRKSPPPSQPDQERPRGVGSGFILSSDGLIMTNAHVLDGADEVMVTLADKREFKAKIIGADKRTDVALVKISATGLPAVQVGDVNKLRVGEWVLAFGSPYGLENTVTKGIVSAKQRDTGDYLPFIQSDVPINPGNSGGPLVNMRGEVVGINSQIYSRSGGSVGISFSIPMDEAMRVSDQLRTKGRVVRGRIGVQISDVTKDIAEATGLSRPAGAFVSKIEAGAPADKAGLKSGDIITKFDGNVIEKSSDLPRMIGSTTPGSKSSITVIRRGQPKEFSINIAEIEPDTPAKKAATKPDTSPKAVSQRGLGLSVVNLSEEDKRELKATSGVKIEAAEGAAARAGLREGDVIVAVANQEVSNLRDYDAAVASADKNKPLTILFHRGEFAQFALIRPDAKPAQ